MTISRNYSQEKEFESAKLLGISTVFDASLVISDINAIDWGNYWRHILGKGKTVKVNFPFSDIIDRYEIFESMDFVSDFKHSILMKMIREDSGYN